MKTPILFPYAVLLKGFSSVIAQTLLIRELLIVFCGNELTLGLTLSAWLILSSIGSSLLARLFKNAKHPLRPFCLFQILLASWLPLSIALIRTSKLLLNIPAAEIFAIGHIVTITFLAFSFLALSDGAMFSLSVRLIPSITRLYVFECLGVIVGGIALTFILWHPFNSFQIALVVSCFNLLCCALLLLLTEKNHALKLSIGLLFLAIMNLFSQTSLLHQTTLALQWQKKDIMAYENSVYGNIAVFREPGQITIAYNGLPTISLPTPDGQFAEDFVHIPLLARPYAKKILFAGTAAGGLLREALKYPAPEIVYAEIDPVFLKTIRAFADPATKQELTDPRIVIKQTDARAFIKTTREKFDLIYVNIGLPTTLGLNRYYTKEFAREAKKCLNSNGIAIFKTWGSLAYLSDEMKKINASLLVTLKSVFAHCEVLPGDGFNIFLASESPVNLNADLLSDAWKKLSPKSYLINPAYLRLRLQQDVSDWFYDNIKKEMGNAPLNQDLRPTGLYEGLGLYYSQFSKKIPKFFIGLKKIKASRVALSVVIFLVLWWNFLKQKDTLNAALNFTIFSTGFFAMATQTIVFFLFQSLLGYLFFWLAILTMSFMTGASLGALIVSKNRKNFNNYKALGRIEILLPLITASILFLAVNIDRSNLGISSHIRWLFSLMSLTSGALVGLELPIAFSLSSGETTKSSRSSPRIAGTLYSLDLIGACLGILITPLLLIPSCGIIPTILILCLLKFGNGWTITTLHSR